MKLIIFYEWRNNEFSQEMLKKTRAKYLETDPYYTLNTHIHIPRWTKDLNVKKLVAYTCTHTDNNFLYVLADNVITYS